jgi:hypothetical protein
MAMTRRNLRQMRASGAQFRGFWKIISRRRMKFQGLRQFPGVKVGLGARRGKWVSLELITPPGPVAAVKSLRLLAR